MTLYRASITAAVIFGIFAIAASSATAQKKYGPGVTDTEIKIGNMMPYSGPASSYGVIGKTEAAYSTRSM
jgi:branched-chain amino acid transport system substrate-binding protein